MHSGEVCPHCKDGIILYVYPNEPYNQDGYFICSKCDSTYNMKGATMEKVEVERSKMDALERHESELRLEYGNLSSEEKYHSKLGFLKGFKAGYDAARGCDGCVHEPEKKGEDPYPEVCGSCSRFYGDMHSIYFMEE